MNKGERNELLIKIQLVYFRDHGITDYTCFSSINSVGFAGKEYKSLPKDFDPSSLKTISDKDLSILAKDLNIQKASTYSKSDIYINGKGYSLKSLETAPPAIVNHTARPGFEFACANINININTLDVLVSNYWSLRLQNKIKEDVKNTNPLSPFKDAKKPLEPILKYFLFDGTGQKLSEYPADFILDYYDPLDPGRWSILEKDIVIFTIWKRLIFSIRSTKGMPSNYPNNKDKKNNPSVAIWTKFFQNKYRGALHIRVGKE